jgi:hypothetical protein
MSITLSTELNADLEAVRNELFSRYVDQHGKKMAITIEALTKTMALVNGLQHSLRLIKCDATIAIEINAMVHAYGEYMISHLCSALGMEKEQFGFAADESIKLMERLHEVYSKHKEECDTQVQQNLFKH